MTEQGVPHIAVDVEGGDFSPDVVLQGCREALHMASGFRLTLVGRKSNLSLLEKFHLTLGDRLAFTEATDVISMEDHGALVVRKKPDSSIHVGLNLVKSKAADAFLSAGNSGAIMAGAAILLGRTPGVERPAIVVHLPRASGSVMLLDAGANVDCKPQHLVQFAVMGTTYANVLGKIPSPRVGLLSNGSEAHKGNELTREVHQRLQELSQSSRAGGMVYVGYVEGNHLLDGSVDVVVCDGFTGNIALKVAEGVASTTAEWLKVGVQSRWTRLFGAFLLRHLFGEFRARFDYQPYGAAPLLGIDGLVLVSHGASTAVAIRNGILTAKRGVEEGFIASQRDAGQIP